MSSTEADIQGHRIWLLRLVFNFRFGGWLSGALIFLVLFGLFKTFTFHGYAMEDFRSGNVLQIIENMHQVINIVTVDRAKIPEIQ